MNTPLVAHILDEDAPPSIIINPHSALGKELRKWEQHKTDLVPTGTQPGNPYVYRPYPKMLYKAQKTRGGQWRCMEQQPHPYDYERQEVFERAMFAYESFNRSCQKTVGDESEHRVAMGQGWAESPDAAIERCEQEQQAFGNASAEVLAAARGMSEQARGELKAAENTTSQHVVDVKAKRKYTRKSKATPVAVTGSGEVPSE